MAGWSGTQDGQVARIKTALEGDETFLEGFTHVEALGEPFRLTCEVVCEKLHSFMAQRGTGVSVTVDAPQDTALINRSFHGLLTEASLTDTSDGVFHYTLTARPWFWILSLGRDSRIFQHMSARDIIKEVFTKAGVADSQYDFTGLSARGTLVREYCVQFEESDFAFVSRLMEEEGVYYFFQHTADSHVMMLCDSKDAHPAFAHGAVTTADSGGDVYKPHLAGFGRRLRPTIAEYAVRDQHFKKFGDPLDAKAPAPDLVGAIKAKVFQYPGGFAYLTDDGATKGDDYAELRRQADVADALLNHGSGNVFALATGLATTINWQDTDVVTLITRAVHTFSGQRAVAAGEDGEPDFEVEIECVPLEQGWRSHLVTPKPQARGPQIAMVVGKTGEEIDVDEFGRVRVQFPWDRSGKSDETSSCWVRVSSSWAGPSMGESFLPRIGQEVLISYIDGDIDRPLVTGRLFDSTNKIWPTVGGGLPGDKTQSGWKSQTVYGKSTEEYDGAVKPPTDEPGFNLIAFEDRAKAEKVVIRAQREFWLTVFRDWKSYIHRDRLEKVGRNAYLEIETGDETHTVTAGKRTTTIHKDETLTVEEGDMSTTVSKKNKTTEVKVGDISVKATAGQITMEAAQKITLKVGSCTLIMDQTSITLDAPVEIKVKSGMTIGVKAGIQVTSEAGAQNTMNVGGNKFEATPAGAVVKGAMVLINSGG